MRARAATPTASRTTAALFSAQLLAWVVWSGLCSASRRPVPSLRRAQTAASPPRPPTAWASSRRAPSPPPPSSPRQWWGGACPPTRPCSTSRRSSAPRTRSCPGSPSATRRWPRPCTRRRTTVVGPRAQPTSSTSARWRWSTCMRRTSHIATSSPPTSSSAGTELCGWVTLAWPRSWTVHFHLKTKCQVQPKAPHRQRQRGPVPQAHLPTQALNSLQAVLAV
mmetsp:Transcript_32772/g.88791  ORF Transcript_32772/g.88791 Transcript_32772/m.88791 type:complete len:222 (+) Transcript_32772:734-1399(+)